MLQQILKCLYSVYEYRLRETGRQHSDQSYIQGLLQ